MSIAYLLYPSPAEGQEYEFVEQWPEEAWRLRTPSGIAVDGSGNVYVVDFENHRIQKFDSEGDFLTKWG
ncbi:MAG: 6-bladed beta-propeller, partial [Ketobacter sp.]|nr:6-bladed beta-propeller [Ketobacter sp.]